MRAGILRHHVTFLQKDNIKDSFGAVKGTYTNYKTVKAALLAQAGNKVTENSEIFNVKSKDFQVRYDANISEEMRLLFKGETYKIISIQEVGFRDSLIIKTELLNG